MAAAARLSDSIAGITGGEHSGHIKPPHPPMSITGMISGGCSGNVYINGMPAAVAGSTTMENDGCCGTSFGSVGGGSGSVFINHAPAARMGDPLNAHSGTGSVTGGSPSVFIGG